MRRIAASLSFFTRIPAWKIINPSSDDFKKAPVYWPFTGWITAGITAMIIYGFSYFLPLEVAVVLALAVRCFLTSALHEDGLADFFDGFGGGRNREHILQIMKDSHIGTYGVISLILYFALAISLLSSMPAKIAALTIFAADPFSKSCASQIIEILPYAGLHQPKNGIHYSGITTWENCLNIAGGTAPVIPLCIIFPGFAASLILPLITISLVIPYLRKKIEGYTGDCCGASYLLCELSMLIGVVIIYCCIQQ